MTDDPQPGAAEALHAIGPYRIERLLGSGGMGAVYRAVSTSGDVVALKVLHPGLESPELQKRFEREQFVRIAHPNIVRVLDAGVDGGRQFIAFSLLEGESLEDRICRGPLPAHEVIDIGIQVCAGLEAAHAAHIVHRDLKPANLFCCKDGTLKILDFGIALVTTRETRLTRQGGAIGTPCYMAPEQVRGDEHLDPRADLWSLGVVLYEMLAGAPPWDLDTALATMLAIVMQEPPPLWARAQGISPALAATIERALAKPLDLRWQSAHELATALQSLAAETPVAAAPELVDTQVFALGNTVASTATQGPVYASLIAPGEHRIVAVVLAEGVLDARALDAAIRDHGGVLVPLVGRRAVGLFGAERWEGDEVARAASAALAARAAAERVAVASGRAKSAGSAISGDVLSAVERGCALGLGGVAVDAATARALEAEFVVLPSSDGFSVLRGKKSQDRSLSSINVDGPTVGREAELARVERAVRQLREESRPVVLLVTGPPGIGKSRLRRAMEQELAPHRHFVQVFVGRGEPLRSGRALSLLAESLMARALADAGPSETGAHGPTSATGAEAEDALRHLVDAAIEEPSAATECAEFLAELVGLPVAGGTSLRAARVDPQLMVDHLRLAVLDLFEGLCRQTPLALVLEDLQWADPASLALLEELLDRLSDAPLLLFASARPELLEAHPALFSSHDVMRLELRGLRPSEVASLAEWLAEQPLPEPLVRALAEHTAGHPFFVEQIVLELKEQGRLAKLPQSSAELERGDAPDAMEPLPLPWTVEAAVQSRLDHLPAPEKDACKRGSVLGRAFTADELEAMGVAGAAAVLGSLVRRDLVATRAKPGRSRERLYLFRSAVVSQVAYGLIADETRLELHRRAAIYLARSAGADDEEIATHHDRGGQAAEAAERYAAAALGAAPRGDASTVLRCSARALELGAAQRFALYMARAEALRFLGRRDEQAVELSAAGELAATDHEHARLLTARTELLSRTGKRDDAIPTAEHAVAAAERAGDPDVVTAARGWLVLALIYAGQIERARSAFEAALATATAASPHMRAILASTRGHLATAIGDLGERREAFTAAAALFREAGDLRRAAAAEGNLADVENRVGNYVRAELALRTALDGCRRVKNRGGEGYALVNLGYALWRQGRPEEAVAALDQAHAIATSAREVRLALYARCYRARARLESAPSDVVEEALAVAGEADRVREAPLAILARATAARARLALGDAAGALELSSRALDDLEALGGIEEDEAEVYVAHARALEGAGRDAGALDVRRRGRERVTSVAERISDAELRRQFLEAVPAHRELLEAERPLHQGTPSAPRPPSSGDGT